MKIQEADAKSLLVAQGLPVPGWEVAHTAAEARAAAERFFAAGADAVVIKAQVLVGGRGKAGGVKLAGCADEAEPVAASILGMDIKGITVRKVLVGPAADIVKEFYMSAVLDGPAGRILLMGSAEGGVEIEQVAADQPRGDRPRPRRPAARAARLPGARARVRDGPRRAPEGRRGDRQGPGPDDARLRRRPRRDQPAGDRPRGAARTGRRRSASSASTPRSPSTTRRSPATRVSRNCAIPTRRIRPTARPARPG